MVRIAVLDKLSPEGLKLLEQAPDVEYEVRTGLAGEELREFLLQFDGAICRSGVKLSADVLAGNRRLRAIARAGVGTDNIDKQAATRAGIVVMNTPHGNTISTAEHTMALLLALARNIAPAFESLKQGRWERSRYMGTQLAGKTLGIIGLGRIGQAVAARAKAFQMRVVGYDPYLSRERAETLGIEALESIEELLPQADFLTVHTPLTPETRNLINRENLHLLKPGVRLINAARGGIYEEQALLEGLKSGHIAGVALDVYEQEPCTESPLFELPGVVCTPHLGASTEEAQALVAKEAVELLLEFFRHGTIRHAVNVVPLSRQELDAVGNELNVAYRLGRFLAAWHQGAPRRCRLEYRGQVAEKATRLVTAAFCVGLLEGALEEEVNLINAEVLLRDRGIQLEEQTRDRSLSFQSLITAQVETDRGTFKAGGTVFGQRMIRLVQVDDFRLEAYLDGILLAFRHRDVPGIIGHIGTIFGSHGVNIAQMAVGRAGAEPGGEAVGVMNLDSLPPEEALQQVAQHEAIQRLQVIQLPAADELPAWLGG